MLPLHEAMLYEKIEGKKVRCNLCGRRCLIQDGTTGFCRVRRNNFGILYTLNYAKACAANVDPIGKKPLSHFHPGSSVLSVATVGCNFRCQFCDNWNISQEKEVAGKHFPPEDVVNAAISNGCIGISYTYTEPTIFFEYAYDISILAHRKGLFNTFVTNGFMTPEAVRTISPYLDAATVDFKGGGDPEFYKKFSAVPSVEPIYECLKEMKAQKIHIEITNLVIPKIGDSIEMMNELTMWIKNNLGPDTPLHLLRFHPDYKLTDIISTEVKKLEEFYENAKEQGLNYVYLGNVPGHKYEHTYCPNCHEILIKRYSFSITEWNLTKEMCCQNCGKKIPIKGELHKEGFSIPYSIL